MDQSYEDIAEFELDRRTAFLYALGSIFMGPVMAFYGVSALTGGTTSLSLGIASTATGLFFSGFLYNQILLLVTKGPGLVLSPSGILNRSTFPGSLFVPWSEVKSVTCPDVQRPEHYAFHLAHPKRYMASASLFGRVCMHLAKWHYKTPVVVTPNSLRCRRDELAAAIQSFTARYVASE